MTPQLTPSHLFCLYPGEGHEAEYADCLSALIANVNTAAEFNMSIDLHVHRCCLLQAKGPAGALPLPDRARLRSQVTAFDGVVVLAPPLFTFCHARHGAKGPLILRNSSWLRGCPSLRAGDQTKVRAENIILDFISELA